MSRRKQPNPNKVKLMDSAAEEKRPGDAASSALATKEAEPTEEAERHAHKQEREKHSESVGATERADGGMDAADGADLSSINSMMSTVMKATLNGGVDPSPSVPTKTPIKSPSGRNARKNQETKDDGSSLVCPLCGKNCQTQHQLTMHIRQHNSDTGATDHSCSICGKCLSSASSLDRHMLVHSGERPYKCSMCGQTFTTNGNMHRHMKIHDKDSAISVPTSPPSPVKRRRPSAVKRKSSHDEDGDRADEPSSKRVVEDGGTDEPTLSKGQEESLTCPICFKTLSSKYDLEVHMDTHPDSTLRCELCCLSFRTHRGLLRHNAGIHKQLPTDPSGKPFIQNNPSIPLGFNDLAFIDFSCRKFSHIAQVWCESNLRRCTSKFHRFVCETCDKAFPLRSALDLHKTTHESSGDAQEATPSQSSSVKPYVPEEKNSFMDFLGLQHVSTVKPLPSEEEALQAELDSIRVIHVETPSSLQEAEMLGGVGLSLVDPTSLRGMSQNEALKLLSLQPFQTSFFVQPDGGMVVKPVCGESGVELADIQQILKVASAAPNHISLPPLSKAPCSALQSVYKQMPPLKPKPLVAPRTNMATSTPPPPLTTQQASLGCVSPSLPPPAGHLLKPAKELSPSTSSSSSSACKQASMERIQMEADCMGDAQTPMDVDEQQIKQEEDKVGETSGKKGTARKGSYPCRFCDQVFAYSGVLQAHMRYHLGILPHQCNICDYVAPDKATLIRHLRTHSGERPYVCRVCHYPFTVKANCERHLRKKHMKNTRKEIEKNIKYVTSSSSTLEKAGSADTTCRFCGEDLKTYRALQIHRCTLNGFQRKPFECKRCGAAFLARRNCIHHLLKQHPEVKEQEIEQYIATPLSTPSQASPNSSPHNGVSPSASLRPVKVEDLSVYSGDLDQPLDFSNKSRGSSSSTGSSSGSPGIKIEAASYESSMEPIDLSIPKQVKKDTNGVMQKEVKKEQVSLKIADSSKGMQMEKATDEKPQHLGCYQLPVALTALTASNATGRPLRLKPLLPKPTSAGVKEMPPLASIAKIISSVSAAPDLLKRENSNSYLPISDTSSRQEVGNNSVEELPLEGSKVKSKKRLASNSAKEKPTMNLTDASVDLESSGEFASVERMLATTDTNKFSTYLQTNTIDLGRKEEEQLCDKRDSKDEKHLSAKQASHSQQSKGKKNAYSNSVQKMTCPFCPRVFPWASSLQRHMLTHTGQKPYPCPKCEALFSTKSNCERHLLRKHGITNRILRQNGVMPKVKEPEEASQESAESMSETELSVSEAMDITNSGPERAAASDAEKPSPAKPTEAAAVNTLLHQGEQEHQQTPEPEEKMDTENDNDDALSSKSLDLNFANRLIEFKFSESDQPQSSPATECDTQERATPHDDSKFTCKSCNKSFRYPATLARHEKVHLLESAAEASNANPQANHVPEPCEPKKEEVDEETEKEEQKGAAESEGAGSAMDSASEEEKEEKEGRSDEEGEATESKSCEGETVSSGNKSDKRKKICSVCSKRFWSLQDLTRHMRSHTGERPYKCQTCERTFTLKHSLVRHQRVHQKPRGSDGDSSTAPLTGRGGDEDGFSGRSASEGECTPTSTNPPSENENESEVTESIKASPCPESGETDSKSATAEPEASENGIEGEKIATTAAAEEVETDEAEPATQTSKEHLAEEQAADSPVASSTEAERPEGFLQGLLEIHSNPSSEHILSPSELPLVGVE